jgi:hypothetical protein
MNMKVEKAPNFINQVIIASIISFIIASYPVYAYASELQVYSIICGYLIGLVNAFSGYKLNNMAFNKPVKMFMILVFGGMGIRMMFIAISIVILLYIAKLDEVSLVATVFFFYILFAALEINYLHKKQLLNKKAASTDS